jgi:hypothetical protein
LRSPVNLLRAKNTIVTNALKPAFLPPHKLETARNELHTASTSPGALGVQLPFVGASRGHGGGACALSTMPERRGRKIRARDPSVADSVM